MKLSIKHKIFFSFSFVYLVFGIILFIVINNLVEAKNEEIIENEMIYIERSINIYLEQFFQVYQINPTEETFIQNADKIRLEIINKTQQDIALYDKNGTNIKDFFFLIGLQSFDKLYDNEADVKKSLEGKSVVAINTYNNTTIVYLSSPIKINGQTIGIIRYQKDYTYFYSYSYELLKIISFVLLLTFIIILIISFIISKSITKPIVSLRNAVSKLTKKDFKIPISFNCHDEIGDLAQSFEDMRKKIADYIEQLKKDNDLLKNAEENRRNFYRQITHEFKTPLTSIMGYNQLLEMNYKTDPDIIVDVTKEIKKQSNRLNYMVHELLELSKQSEKILKKDKAQINVSSVIKSACDQIQMKATRYKVTIIKKIQRELYLYCVEDDLKTIFLNVLDNAIKYGKLETKIKVLLFVEKNELILKVMDSGIGMTDEHISKIFDPFYRINKKTSNSISGNGLGLTIVKQIIEKYKGIIEIASKINIGTTVTIKFPYK